VFKRLKDGFIIVLVAVGLFLGLELSTRIFASQSSKTEFINPGKTAAIQNPSGTHRLRPDNHYRSRKPEYTVVYEINAEGMRDRATYLDRERDPTIGRILLLGDSFTYGQGVAYEQIWSVLIEKGLRATGSQVEVVKAGIPGYDTRAELEYLMELYENYQPDYFLIGFLPNDLFTNQPLVDPETINAEQVNELQQEIRKRAKEVTRGVKKTAQLHSVTLAKRLVLNVDGLYCALYSQTPRARYFTVPQPDDIRHQFEITRDLFIQMHEFSTERNIGLAVVSIPQQFQVYYKASDRKDDGIDVDYVDEYFGGLARERGFAWIPTLEQFAEDYKASEQDHYYRLDGHLTAYGNQVLSDIVVNRLGAILRSN